MSSYDYWKEREEAQRKKNIKDEKEYDKEIKKIYQNMMDRINNEIYSFYAKYASDNGITMREAKKELLNLILKNMHVKQLNMLRKKIFQSKQMKK